MPAALADAPNVLVIAVDTLRADALAAYGSENDTPGFDWLAEDGLVYEKNYAAASWTRSSFATLWTSLLPSSHNADTKGGRLSDEAVLISEVIHGAGGTTANFANNINVTETFGFNQGYDTFVYEAPDYAFGATESVFGLTLYKVVHKLNERLFAGAKRVSDYYQPADKVFADTLAFIDANAESRWFAIAHVMEPHDPFFEHPDLDDEVDGSGMYNGVGFARAEVPEPDPSEAPYLERLYAHEVELLDQHLSELLEGLDSRGIYDDTVIVVVADHGEEFAEHGGFWHGTTLYEEQIRVPLIVKLAGNELAGTRVPFTSRNLDVAPTLASIVGLEAASSWQGGDLVQPVRDLVAAAEAEAQAKAELLETLQGVLAETTPIVESGEADEETLIAHRDAESQLAELEAAEAVEPDPCDAYGHPEDRLVIAEEDFEGNELGAIVAGGFKVIDAVPGGPRGNPDLAMFDLVADGGEQTDLSESGAQQCGTYHQSRRDSLVEQLAEVQAAAAAAGLSGGDLGDGAEDCATTCQLCKLGYKEWDKDDPENACNVCGC